MTTDWPQRRTSRGARRGALVGPGNAIAQLFPRAMACLFAGAAIAVVAGALNISDFEMLELTTVAFFWVAAFMTATLIRHPPLMLLWLLLMDAALLLYQVVLYRYSPELSPGVRLAPVLIGGAIFMLAYSRSRRGNPLIYAVWVVLNLPALFSAVRNDLLPIEDSLTFFAINVVYPLLIYRAFAAGDTSSQRRIRDDTIAFGVIALATAPLLMIPIELNMRGSSAGFASLQFGGRAYAVIGVIFLTWPILMKSIRRWPLTPMYGAFAIIALTMATSFSRGAIAAAAAMVAATLLFETKAKLKNFFNLSSAAVGLVILAALLAPTWLSELSWFWLLRANLVSNASSGFTFDVAELLSSGRAEIWSIAWELFKQEPIWGHGIGSTPSLISSLTRNQFTYSGMHNQLLTVLVERGSLGLVALLFLLFRIYQLIISGRTSGSRIMNLFSMTVFLVFANTTGVELFLNSTRIMNASLILYLLGYLGYLEAEDRELRHDPARRPATTEPAGRLPRRTPRMVGHPSASMGDRSGAP